MPGASRPGAHFRVDFDDVTFTEDLEHTSSDARRELAQRERNKLTSEGVPPASSSAATPRPETGASTSPKTPGHLRLGSRAQRSNTPPQAPVGAYPEQALPDSCSARCVHRSIS
jgi:hypothetical protein